MDISLEKEEIIRKFNQVHDMDLIKAIKSLLDFGLQRQDDDGDEQNVNDIALQASIDRALNESKNGLGRPHKDVMADLRKRYNL